MVHTLINDPAVSRKARRGLRFNNRQVALSVTAVALLAACSWLWSGTRVVDLGVGTNLVRSDLVQRWSHGDVVVMVRHAERCDRSSNPCLGSAEGITKAGSNAALAVGSGLQRLGLDSARLMASPTVRTQQTAEFISGHVVPGQGWLSECNSGFKEAVLAHKQPRQNLVLITHSGCIDQFERQMGVHAADRSSAYAQAFFVRVDGKHAPKILGSMDAAQWKNLTVGQWN